MMPSDFFDESQNANFWLLVVVYGGFFTNSNQFAAHVDTLWWLVSTARHMWPQNRVLFQNKTLRSVH